MKLSGCIWQVLGLAVAGSAVFATFTFWVSVRKEPVRAIAEGKQFADGFDVIAIQLDILTLAITAMGIALGVAAIFGYQALKDAAQSSAEKTAQDTADKVATKAVAEHIEKLEDWRRGFATGPSPTAPSLGQVEEVKTEEKNDVGAARSSTDNPRAPEKRPRRNNRNRASDGDKSI